MVFWDSHAQAWRANHANRANPPARALAIARASALPSNCETFKEIGDLGVGGEGTGIGQVLVQVGDLFVIQGRLGVEIAMEQRFEDGGDLLAPRFR